MGRVLLELLLSGAFVAGAGVALTHYGDALGVHLRLGRVWVGSVLLAGATSLPELTTDVAAVRHGAPDLAAGDLFGSNMANMLILGLVDLLPGADLLRRATVDHALTGCVAIGMNAAALLFLLVPLGISMHGVGLAPVLLLLMYLAGVRVTLRRSATVIPAGTPDREEAAEGPSLLHAAIGFALAAAVIVVAAPRFATGAEHLATLTGVGQSFVGALLLGLATSLPELVSSLAALRMKAFDLAVANLFGSNALNMSLFFALELASPEPDVLAALSPDHAVTGLVAIVLMTLGLATIVARGQRRFTVTEPSSALIVLAWAAGIALLYHQTR